MRQHQFLVTAALVSANVFAAARPVSAQPLTISHFAGSAGGPDWFDGIGSGARFNAPSGVAVDRFGNVYVADTGNNTIRKATPGGEVSTLAGFAGSWGSVDGAGAAARFNHPQAIAVDGSGNVFVADTRNHTIRRVTPDGVVSTIAGLAGDSGSADGLGSAARFKGPSGVAVDDSGYVYVTDRDNYTIRKIAPSGEVATLAGLAGSWGSTDGRGSDARFFSPCGIAVDDSGNAYVADTRSRTIRKVTQEGVVSTLAGRAGNYGSTDGAGAVARFHDPEGVAVDGAGTVYVADTGNGKVRKISPVGVVSTLAGGMSDPVLGYLSPASVAVDGSGHVYVADPYNHSVRKISPSGFVSAFVGLSSVTGSLNGPAPEARFSGPMGVAVDVSGNVYVADTDNGTVRKVSPTGTVSTLAGLAGSIGRSDGTGSEARFNTPMGIAADSSGNVYVADKNNGNIRKVSPAGVVSTLAGQAGPQGSNDGPGNVARFAYPVDVAVDDSGNVYVADSFNGAVRIVSPQGIVSTLTRGLTNPTGVAVDVSGNVYVSDGSLIRKVSPAGVVSTFAGAGGTGSIDGGGPSARFSSPSGLAFDASGNLYVADRSNCTIHRITPSGVASTVAGLAGICGSSDGTGPLARFNGPRDTSVDTLGNVFVADGSCIRKGTAAPTLADVATIDKPIGFTGQVRQLGTSARTATEWLWEEVRRPANSAAALSASNTRSPTFTPDVPDLYVFRLTASDASSSTSISTVSLTVRPASPAPDPPLTRLLPIVLDVASGSAHYTTELALTNNGMSLLPVSLLYTASLGSKRGSGMVTDFLAPGEQKKVGDVLSWLRDKGLAIPPVAEEAQQGGTLLVSFEDLGALDPRLVSATARTAALTSAPQPSGRAGLAYAGLLPTETSTSFLTIYGLRSSPADRSNLAVFNTSGDPVTLKVTVCSGTGDGRCVVVRAAETLPAYGWMQFGSGQILDGNGISKGWAVVERISTAGSFGAYGVINDNATNDGSFVLPAGSSPSGSTLTVPILVETPTFRSELILANKGTTVTAFGLSYVESINPSSGSGGGIVVELPARQELIIPDAIDYLRKNGVDIGAKDAAAYGGALLVSLPTNAAENVFAGARTASQSPASAGGQFGLFTPCVYTGQEALTEAYLYGLRADSENRTNVAVLNAGNDSAGPVLLQLQAYDGDAGGVPKGSPVSVSLAPGQWAQPPGFFESSGVANGWVKVTRMSGTAPWITYAVVNDGANPGERTGDGAYVPMVK